MSSNNVPYIAAVLVTFNPDLNIFQEVINTISSQVQHLIVIDNCSKNRLDISLFLNGKEGVVLLPQNNNIGLAAAQNIGIQYVKENINATHVILFDQDSIIKPYFISSLVNEELGLISKGIKVGAIGPSFYDPDNNQDYPATVYIGPFIKRVKLGDNPVEATFLIASGCLINLNVLKNVGGMLEELFIDYIDVEWSLRAKKFGYRLFITPKASMAHTIGDKRISLFGRTVSCHSSFRRYFLVRNSFKMLRLPYIPIGYKVRETVFNFLRVIIGLATSSDRKKFIKYTLAAFKDGFFGKFGPCKYNF
ncbi:rhamnosyltransferase [Salmonella enterica]|uniref:rhamnosyltransferase n=1 Tax=Salmonella enterica TaxID=28901 RepID=UPI0014826E9A|nr:rhamnosyltransferase [Salmonella enterica]